MFLLFRYFEIFAQISLLIFFLDTPVTLAARTLCGTDSECQNGGSCETIPSTFSNGDVFDDHSEFLEGEEKDVNVLLALVEICVKFLVRWIVKTWLDVKWSLMKIITNAIVPQLPLRVVFVMWPSKIQKHRSRQ